MLSIFYSAKIEEYTILTFNVKQFPFKKRIKKNHLNNWKKEKKNSFYGVKDIPCW